MEPSGKVEKLERLLSRTEVAEMLRVPASTVASWAHRGIGPRYFRVGRHTRYRLADVRSWLETKEGR